MPDAVLQATYWLRDFWSRVKGHSDIDNIIWDAVNPTLYRMPAKERARRVAKLRGELVSLFRKKYMPEAIDYGQSSAAYFIRRMEARGIKVTPSRAAALVARSRLSIKRQMDILRMAMARESQHALANLETFIAQGQAMGRTKKDIVQQLVAMHERERAAIKKAEAKGKSLRTVRTFGGRLAVAAKGVVRDNFRRVAQQAEFFEFKRNGLGTNGFAWVACNGSEACPDCAAMHGVLASESEWASLGRPGDGTTICGSACMCRLVPEEYVRGNSAINEPIRYKEPVNLDEGMMRRLNRHRADPDTARQGAPMKTHKAKQPGAPQH